jgi:hypothetical protein
MKWRVPCSQEVCISVGSPSRRSDCHSRAFKIDQMVITVTEM